MQEQETPSRPAAASLEILPGDPSPVAPPLAHRGPYGVGVQTVQLTHTAQPDPVRGGRSDRTLTVELWYPSGRRGTAVHHDAFPPSPGVPARPFSFVGRGARDAPPLDGPWPVALVAHGYPGSRVLMTHLAEPLASRGWLVIAADHPRSTHLDLGPFVDTLLHRPRDLLFLVGWLDAGLPGAPPELAALPDEGQRAVLGYSMGGYGALLAAGARLDPTARLEAVGVPSGWSSPLAPVLRGRHGQELDAARGRIGTIVAFAPWGGRDAILLSSLAEVRARTLLLVGDADLVSGYGDGVVPIFEHLRGTHRRLVTLSGMGHNVVPDPPPAAAWRTGDADGYRHYADAVWDPRTANDLVRHLTVAFLQDAPAEGPESGAWSVPAALSHALRIRTGEADLGPEAGSATETGTETGTGTGTATEAGPASPSRD